MSKVLYAICLERRARSGKLMANIEYMHAEDRAEVVLSCMNGSLTKGTRVVNIAPVVGFWGEEDENRNLIVSV